MGAPKIPKAYIKSLDVNGLSGRVLELPRPKKNSRDVLFIYGHHANLERMYSIAKSFNEHAGIIMPDLPGFGGMDSMYSIGMEPTLDNFADYLASYIKLRFPNRRKFVIAGFSYGFLVVTRFMQKYPDLARQVEFVISVAGFTNSGDFKFKKRNFYLLKFASALFSHKYPSLFVKYIVLRKTWITMAYNFASQTNPKMKILNPEERPDMINFEVILWQCNDPRTYMKTANIMLKVDLTKQKVPRVLHHVSVSGEQYFNAETVNKNMHKIYSKLRVHKVKMHAHMPTVIEEPEQAGVVIPASIRKIVARK